MLTGVLGNVSNRATWSNTITILDEDTNEPIDLSQHRIIVQIARQGFLPPSSGDIVLTASTDDDSVHILPGFGVFEFTFPAVAMRGLEPGSYDVGVLMQWADEENSLLIGSVGVVDGVTRLT